MKTEDLIGLTLDEARNIVITDDDKNFIHIDQEDDKICVRTCDVNPNRFGVTIKNGIITKASNG